jgi:hypothetical protein
VRGIINNIWRAPGCFLFPKNVFTKIRRGKIEKVERRSVWGVEHFLLIELIGGREGEESKQ